MEIVSCKIVNHILEKEKYLLHNTYIILNPENQ